ncbi:MAG: putative uridylyltransferase [Phycisphaerae bacterium]|nr:putative uridylyltransferase [Phycisphaerae bacterium]
MSRADSGELRRRAEAAGQGHLFRFWDRLTEPERDQLIEDVRGLDFAQVRELSRAAEKHEPAATVREPEPPTAFELDLSANEAERAKAKAVGWEHIRAGRVAALLVAGGQGTRLGFEGPKGMFPVSPVRGATLFRWFAEALEGVRRRCGVVVPWYVMTSPVNDEATRAYFRSEGYFGRDAETVRFFVQGTMPAATEDGRILLAERHRVALSPNGHGGTLMALAESGCLEEMKASGVESVSYFQVDNPLVRPVDPVLIGARVRDGAEVTSATIGKADDFERVGHFVRRGDRVHVIEYTEMPEALARRRDAAGRRVFDSANLSIFVFARSFLERITRAGGELPWHRALKKVPHVDPDTGRLVEPAAPNAIKFERFVFDALPLTDRVRLVRSRREECFSPVKNATGADSPETARRDLSRRAARWLAACGVEVPADEAGIPRHPCEISPAVAQDAEELREALASRGRPEVSGRVCFAP